MHIIFLFPLIAFVLSDQDFVECGKTKCAIDGGTCIFVQETNQSTCFCNPNFASIEGESLCGTRLKSRMRAFLLELIFCFGAGHFYTQNTGRALVKFFVFMFNYYLFVFLNAWSKKFEDSRKCERVITLFAYFCCFALLSYHVTDLVLILTSYTDGNGLDLI